MSRQMDLIYDVGLHKGEDTAYYLKNGFRVIAFEADPDLVKLNKVKFARSIAERKLIIIEGAIVSDSSLKTVTFYRNLNESEWGTINQNRAVMNERLGTRHDEIEVKTVDFAKCLETYGMPYYMKIDIESADTACLEVLKQFKLKPCSISMESEKVDFQKLVQEFDLFEELGYSEFTAVQQATIYKINKPIRSKEGRHISYRFPHGSSGPFGKDLTNWMSREEILQEYVHIFKRYQKYGDSTVWGKNNLAKACLYAFLFLSGKPVPGWVDTHARLPECDNSHELNVE